MGTKKSINEEPIAMVPEGPIKFFADRHEPVYADGTIGGKGFSNRVPREEERKKLLGMIETAIGRHTKEIDELLTAYRLIKK